MTSEQNFWKETLFRIFFAENLKNYDLFSFCFTFTDFYVSVFCINPCLKRLKFVVYHNLKKMYEYARHCMQKVYLVKNNPKICFVIKVLR